MPPITLMTAIEQQAQMASLAIERMQLRNALLRLRLIRAKTMLSVPEAALFSGESERTIHRYKMMRGFPAKQMGKNARITIHRELLDKWLREQTAKRRTYSIHAEPLRREAA